jgi:hypothetical protein
MRKLPGFGAIGVVMALEYKFMYPESPEIAFMNSKYHIF